MSLLQKSPQELVERIAPLLIRPLETVTRDAVESAMILCGGNRGEAANRLGISRATLYRLLARYRKADA